MSLKTVDGNVMDLKTVDGNVMEQSSPAHTHAAEIQPFGHLVRLPIALSETVCRESVKHLNQLLADTITLRDLYKKHHWQVTGSTFYQLHLLFDKHSGELGGMSLAMAADIAETTLIPRPPKGREDVPTQIGRLLHAHEIVLQESHRMAASVGERGDDGTNDLIVSNVIRTNETQVWFLAEHVVKTPRVGAD
jgi:starvation-inducible DNA-binding protein